MSRQFGYENGQLGRLEEAVTHASFANESSKVLPHNERLEFLGDAVLDLVVAEALMAAHPEAPEGVLSSRRAAIVNARSLASVAESIGLGRVLRLGRGEQRSGGRRKESLLADAFEAVVGAIHSDLGLLAARAVVMTYFEDRVLAIEHGSAHRDYKTALQEWSQKHLNGTPTYRVIKETGPDHDKTFTVEVFMTDERRALGFGRSKKAAQRDAARRLIESLSDRNGGQDESAEPERR
ncbi:MAG: ribonuclease III [Myxococcota bacterium]|nr:ribonuclease III [Myxococcota bacterium]